MAVYTRLTAGELSEIVGAFDVGALISAKGIAEGVSNSNWLIEAGDAEGTRRFILTMYEDRTETSDLPFFLGLLDHLAARDCPVPRTIHDADGRPFRLHEGKALALIEFLPGVSISDPSPQQARAVGTALARVHLAAGDFALTRSNGLGPAAWREIIEACAPAALDQFEPGLARRLSAELAHIEENWPASLPRSVIHADLFPDNVLMLDEQVSGLIDFYFACNDVTAFDVATTHAAWAFSEDGARFDPGVSQALLEGYEALRPLSSEERRAMPLLARAAAMRFIATRVYDWLNTPPDALVTPKDPRAFLRRLAFYSAPENAGIFA